ncbi:hypothetical protein [Tenacibaculum agarivorans]|uniref:hypothetical protein n=1 Tax=Tenacibaculum agarivorans TaxID=1908389 RepID=UPI00094BB2FE|nr:hypothetical protein [Tenacibaculum agarivorans]
MIPFFKKLSFYIFLLTVTSCVSQVHKATNKINEIILNAQTRGALQNIIYVNNTILYKTNDSSKTYFLSKKQIENLYVEVSKINLTTISTLEAPSNKRLFDGALHTTLSLKIDNNKYISSQFDDDNPPKELKEIVSLLRSFIK